MLAEAQPEGIPYEELNRRMNVEHVRQNVVEMIGQAGDVVLLHPFMFHARGPNCGTRARFICNLNIWLKDRMNLNREDPTDYTPVERAIVNAISN